MAQHPSKSTAGKVLAGEGYNLSDYVDLNGNLWVTGSLAITGVTLVNGNLPVTIVGTPAVTISGTPKTNILQVGGTAITLGQKASAASLPVVIASDQSPIQMGLPSITANTAPLNSVSTAYEASRIAKASSGVLFGVAGYNSKGSTQFILLFDATLLPANGAVPVGPVITVPATANFSIDFGHWGMAFNAGIVIANSSTGPTLTIGSADCWIAARYR